MMDVDRTLVKIALGKCIASGEILRLGMEDSYKLANSILKEPPFPRNLIESNNREKKSSSNHPPYIAMVKKAIASNSSRKGTSRETIIRYIRDNYKVDVDRTLVKI